jgi:hypothetical protein
MIVSAMFSSVSIYLVVGSDKLLKSRKTTTANNNQTHANGYRATTTRQRTHVHVNTKERKVECIKRKVMARISSTITI